MSTSSFPSAPAVSAFDLSGRSRACARRLVRGRESDPWWSRGGLIAISVVAAILSFWSLTISGYANSWYSGAALAATQSWHSLFFNAADASGLISLDKGPLSDWMMGLSGRIFGFSSFSLLLPDALCGVAAVILLHNVVRRTIGHRAALVAALMLAVSPISVMMDRYDNPDALLALLLVASAWALVRALESGRLRHILLCGLFVGLAFNTKMLEAYIIVPALALAYLICAPGGVRRRLGHLLAGGVAMLLVSFAWFGTMMLIPAADRPFVADTTNNSWFTLIFGANGLSRLTGGGAGGGAGGAGGATSTALGRVARAGHASFGAAGGHTHGGFGGGGFGGSTGLLRLFTGADVGGQIAWLLPLALVGLLTGLWVTRRAARDDRLRAALILFGLWAIASFVVFSFSKGTFHPYYTSSMAPAVAALAGGGAVMLFDRLRHGWGAALVACLAVAVTAVVSFIVLGDTSSFVPWLRWVILAAAAVAIAGLLLFRASGRVSRPAKFTLALGGSAIALLGGPVAYSIATVGHGETGSSPTAGPASAETSGFGGFGGAGGLREHAARSGSRVGATGRSFASRGSGASDTASRALVSYLEKHRDGAKYLVAGDGSQVAAPIALTSRDPVVTIGGFTGSDPAPTVTQLRTLIHDGQLRYVLLGGGFGGFGGVGGRRGGELTTHGSSGSSGIGALFGQDSTTGSRDFAFAFGRREDSGLTKWVESSCQSVTVPGESSAGSGGAGGAFGTSDLYLCTRADATKGST